MTKPLPRTLQKWAAKNPDIFDEGHAEQDGFNERDPENGWAYWIYFKPGWINTMTETHSIHEDSVRACLEMTKWIRPCECEDCKRR